MSTAAATWEPIADLLPWDRNPKAHPTENVAEIAASIRRFGFTEPIIAWKSRKQVVAGHGRLLAAQMIYARDPGQFLAIDQPAPGLVPVRWMEFASDGEAAAYAIADNRLTEANPMKDEDVAAIFRDLDDEGVSLEGLGYSDEDLKAMMEDANEAPQDTPYTNTIKLPHYEPRGDRPNESTLADRTKTRELLTEIAAANLPEPLREFLATAAQRHTVFHFRNIAEYYCHQTPEVQRLMERSGLVIIDFNAALENGFVKVTKKLAALTGIERDDD